MPSSIPIVPLSTASPTSKNNFRYSFTPSLTPGSFSSLEMDELDDDEMLRLYRDATSSKNLSSRRTLVMDDRIRSSNLLS